MYVCALRPGLNLRFRALEIMLVDNLSTAIYKLLVLLKRQLILDFDNWALREILFIFIEANTCLHNQIRLRPIGYISSGHRWNF